jgi:hypothetical protein
MLHDMKVTDGVDSVRAPATTEQVDSLREAVRNAPRVPPDDMSHDPPTDGVREDGNG